MLKLVFRPILVGQISVRPLSTSYSALGKFLSRKPKKILSSSGEEMPLVVTQLECNEQARSVAEELAKKMRFAGATSQQNNKQTSTDIKRHNKNDICDKTTFENKELDDDDHLPPGFEWKDLPKFRKVYGWDKSNKYLRKLKKLLIMTKPDDSLIVLEGKRLIIEAMKAGLYPSILLFSRVNLLLGFPFDLSKKLAMYQVPYKNLETWSELKTSPGFLATFKKEDIVSKINEDKNRSFLPITLIVDNVRGPDNLGAIYRVAAAVGCKKVIALSGCVNSWNPKVLRAGAGAHFHIPIISGVKWEKIHEELPEFSQVLLADINRDDDISEFHHQSETELASKLSELEERSRSLIVEDIIEYKRDADIDEEELKLEVELASEKPKPGYTDLSYWEEDLLKEYQNLALISKPYFDFQRFNSNQEVVIVIGGETEGISAQAKKFTHSHLGERIYVPIFNKIDSLNVVSATSVILFEVMKNTIAKTKN